MSKFSFRTIIFTVLIVFLTTSGAFMVFLLNVDTIHTYRDIWIETAMNTFHHKWLAEWFFSGETINSVMSKRVDTIVNPEIDKNKSDSPSEIFKSDILYEYMSLNSGDEDFAGNTVYDVNLEQEIAIVNLSTADYKGKLAIIPDPSRIKVAHTSKKRRYRQ